MTPAEMAALQALCFKGLECWSEAAIAEVLFQPGVIFAHLQGGFVLGRVILDEAELLTLAVPPDLRGRGVGRHLLGEFARQAQEMGAGRLFLEVDAGNTAALALYAGAGWLPVGRRRNYYGRDRDALTLVRDLVEPSKV
jgi:ribosomal-protein-alanine N-acetyltransferase